MTTTPIVAATDWAEAQAQPWAPHNEAIRRLESGHSRALIVDRDLTAPPGSCADGAGYLVGGSATGAWASHDGELAVAVGTNAANGWYFIAVEREGFRLYVQDEDLELVYNGSAWVPGDFASAAETTTGTETGKAVTPDGLAGSNYGKRVVTLLVSDPAGDAITTGDGMAYWRVPAILNGWNMVAVAAALTTASGTGAVSVQIHNVTQAADMLSTVITIDESETDSSTAATPPAIDASNDDVATADMLRIDIDGAGAGAKGLMVEMTFQLP